MDIFKDKSVLITGGTGSFGKRMVRRLLSEHEPRRVIVYSRDELKQFEMGLMPGIEGSRKIRFFIGDVRDRDRLTMAMRGVDIVIHAAALKQVPAAEYNPFEFVATNIIGAENVVRAAISASVRRVVALSTDKAANPINLYGATKLAADKIFTAANSLSGSGGARFSVVRYGNVVGSRGSVIPFFQRRIAGGADHLPITDERMTRFWITLDQGVDFVVNALTRMQGGEIFVPKIPSMRITDLARVMAPDMATKVIGIRPGEKLHETMITSDDARNTVELDTCYVIKPPMVFWDKAADMHPASTPVPDDFVYSSDTNTHWVSDDEMLEMIGTAKDD
ncbi:MAG: UDP-N-acetylglucosamine 4,6-dehydratase (inverting) [Alphaproteobacteria bacterium]|nr:UDP-N-acetylglucosamine 4,6-dehydratase (inverting) [Alphaproteobacteria bacterium]MBF0249289.1 UDP-N-acetylglucosamine 4,6-dehydratase (inverting) [Alphaproteobacteria bacterium]